MLGGCGRENRLCRTKGISMPQGLRSPQAFEFLPSGIAKPCQSLSTGAAYPARCLIPLPLVSRYSNMIPVPCTSTDHHRPLEPQVPAEKQESSGNLGGRS